MRRKSGMPLGPHTQEENILHRKLVSLIMMVLTLNAATSVTVLAAGPQDDKEAKATEKVKSRVAKIGVGAKPKIRVRLKNGEKRIGSISEIRSDSFTLLVGKANAPSVIPYSQVKQVKKLPSNGMVIAGVVIGIVSVVGFVAAAMNPQ